MAKDALAHTTHHETAEGVGPNRGHAEQQPGAQGEADGVDASIRREERRQVRLESDVLGRIVRFGRRPVTEQVGADDLSTGVGEQVHPSGLAPVAPERRGEAVHEENRRWHSAPLYGDFSPCPRRARRNPR